MTNVRRCRVHISGPGLVAAIALASGCGHSARQEVSDTPIVQSSELRTTSPVDTDWIKQKAKESGGNYQRLSSDDQMRLNQITNGRGYTALKQYMPK